MTINLSEFTELPLSGEGLIKFVEMCGLFYLKEEVNGEPRLRLLIPTPVEDLSLN